MNKLEKAALAVVAVVASVVLFGTAFAQTEDKCKDIHSGLYSEECGSNFAAPEGYKRFITVQGAGGDGASGDGGDGGSGAGSAGGDGGAGAAGAAGAAGGDGCR